MKLTELITEKELKEMALNEYRRRIVLYRLIDEKMKKKYGMSFEEFEKKNIVKEKGFSWDVEKDAMEWEHALESLRTLTEKLRKIEKIDD
ncbi:MULTISPECIES: hypothetical protein [Thermodesulfovibrio]|uniref:Uncharacterized protein n=1 Tax=Thermodesulfovibrio yellowstonii (strain ATCC 51303 / DSM 11347 / YP87) TaxID=289376 RepID=B5YIF6_THEYD|nr:MULTISPECIES: hypothetical protein [Thermodesulfovibrio]ACI20881.1 hypothetical protein THEYE_A1998 [Thermodesulfovibrio yellowstonii DSM 11347]